MILLQFLGISCRDTARQTREHQTGTSNQWNWGGRKFSSPGNFSLKPLYHLGKSMTEDDHAVCIVLLDLYLPYLLLPFPVTELPTAELVIFFN